MMIKVMSALLATIFIAILFQVPKRNVVLTALGGGLGCLINELCLLAGLSDFFSIFLASLTLAMYSEIMARMRKTTVPTFLISGLFPLVPGAGMYYTMLAIVHHELDNALSTGINTLSTAALMALGILFVSTLSRLIFRQKQSFPPCGGLAFLLCLILYREYCRISHNARFGLSGNLVKLLWFFGKVLNLCI